VRGTIIMALHDANCGRSIEGLYLKVNSNYSKIKKIEKNWGTNSDVVSVVLLRIQAPARIACCVNPVMNYCA
jgi:hypothetical protein